MKHILPAFFLFCIKTLIAQNHSDIYFPAPPVYEDYSDSTNSGYSAVKLFTTSNYYLNTDGNFGERIKKHEKIKFLSQIGIDVYNLIRIDTSSINYNLRVRVIHPDGTSKEIPLPDLIPVKYCHYFYSLNFKVPDVSINDEIEYLLEERYKYYSDSYKLFLFSDIPVKKGSISFTASKGSTLQMKSHGGFPEPGIQKDKYNQTVYTWEDKNIPPFLDKEYNVNRKKVPYLLINQWYYNYKSWNELLSNAFSAEFGDIAVQSIGKIVLKITKNDGLKDDLTKLNAIARVHAYINDSIKFSGYRESEEDKGHSLEYFINNKRMDYGTLKIFYTAMFSYFGIKPEYGYAISKYDGELDAKVVEINDQDDFFFFKFFLDNAEYFVFVKNKFETFALNEIPVNTQGTNAYIYNKDLKGGKLINLPVIDKQYNFKRNKTIISINTILNIANAKASIQYSGNMATSIRNEIDYKTYKFRSSEVCSDQFYEEFLGTSGNDSIKINKEKKNLPPFSFGINYVFQPGSAFIQKENENIIKLNFKNILHNQILKEQEGPRTADYVFETLYTDDAKYYISFDKNIELISPETFNIKTSNEFGNYSFNIKQLNANTIMLNSAYDINQLVLSKDKASFLNELSKDYQKIINSVLTVKILN